MTRKVAFQSYFLCSKHTSILTSPISYHIWYIFANEHARTTNSKFNLEVNLYISRSVFMAITDICDDLTMFHILLFVVEIENM